ncbi:MAG: hypothetical protein ACR2QZ_03815 [Woeseiaceae bacterium]
MRNAATIAAAFACLLFGGNGLAADAHDCDTEAAHPSDPDRVGPGKGSGAVVTDRAIPACRRAVDEQPDVARFHYQLGRAIVYQADANNTDVSEGLTHLQHAADMEYSQAMFVLGLMHRRAGDICASEPLTKKAADQGLKSARITYVNAVLMADYGDCGVSASVDEMKSYLDGATTQVNGYYENMLLANLKRDLDSIAPVEVQP